MEAEEVVRQESGAGIRQEKSFEVMRRCRRVRGDKMKLVVEEAELCRGGSRKGRNCCRDQHFGGCWRTKAQGEEGQMASRLGKKG